MRQNQKNTLLYHKGKVIKKKKTVYLEKMPLMRIYFQDSSYTSTAKHKQPNEETPSGPK